MAGILIFFTILIGLPAVKIIAETYSFFVLKDDRTNKGIFRAAEIISIIVNPVIFILSFDAGMQNDCCSDSAFFSPDHRFTIYFLMVVCSAAYIYSSYRKNLAPPIPELLINSILILGIILNVFIIIQSKDILWINVAGNVPVMLLFFIVLSKNQQLLQNEYAAEDYETKNIVEFVCVKILRAKSFLKFPLLLMLGLPLLTIVSALLYLVGQRPDSVIRAFTDTYKHGLSQLDYMCDNVECGGHYLCSVAANGHKAIVKPIRLGERNKNRIICNRQLLISNAFEELIEERWPVLHKYIRRQYDKIGDCVHRHYHFFNIKLVSDIVFIIMKPLEWGFLIILYLVDRRPENRINRQYIAYEHKMELKVSDKSREKFF